MRDNGFMHTDNAELLQTLTIREVETIWTYSRSAVMNNIYRNRFSARQCPVTGIWLIHAPSVAEVWGWLQFQNYRKLLYTGE